MDYESRYKAMQNAVRPVSERKSQQADDKREQTGMIVMVYDHNTRNLESELTETQHHHALTISSTMHIHSSERLLGGYRSKGQGL